jgi:hypothetical protein
MVDLIQEETYICYLGMREYVLRVEESPSGTAPWPERFRIQLPRVNERSAKEFYGASALEAVEHAVKCLNRPILANSNRLLHRSRTPAWCSNWIGRLINWANS